jgi:puromycin-sensitive aminopeptidase
LPSLQALTLYSFLLSSRRVAEAGAETTAAFLKIASGYKGETSKAIWEDLGARLGGLHRMYTQDGDADTAAGLKAFIAWLFADVAALCGWDASEGEEHTHTQLRAIALSVMALGGDTAVVGEAHRRFDAHVSGDAPLHAELRRTVYGIVLADGGVKEYEQLMGLYDRFVVQRHVTRPFRVAPLRTATLCDAIPCCA